MSRRRVRPDELAVALRAMLAKVDAAELDVSATGRARIEGALVACDVLTGASVDDIVARLTNPS